jgi:hypothetical protein
MDERLRERYQDLFERMGSIRPFGRLRPAKDIRDAILTAEETEEARLREDARWFLLVNFYELIFRPLSGRMSAAERERLLEAVRKDVHTIVRAAVDRRAKESTTAEIEGQSRDAELSAHDIIAAIDSRWGNLQTAAQDLWGT